MINIYVNGNCNGCGGCLDSIYFEEKDNGDAQIKAGAIIPDNALEELSKLSKECPCQAIIIEAKKKSYKEIAKELYSYIDEIKDINKIDNAADVAMCDYRHYIKFNYKINYWEEGFSSYSRAESALRSEVHCIWDDRKEYALIEAQKYVNDDLRKYWDINYPEGIYTQTQDCIKSAVHAISNALYDSGIIQHQLSVNDYSVEFTEWTTRWLLEPECISKDWAQEVHDKLDYDCMMVALHKAKIKSYQEYVDGLFGKTKEKTFWEYSEGSNCEEEIRRQIIAKLILVSKNSAKKEINKIIDEYNGQLVEIRKKLTDLVKSVEAMN